MNKALQFIGYVLLFVFVFAYLLHFFGNDVTPEVGSRDRINELEDQLSEQKDIWHEYAPIAQQGKIAERRMTVANQQANIIREELTLLKGNLEQGTE